MTSQTVLLYLFKSILISGLFIAYYWIALRNKKFHYYNRFYLLSVSLISLIAPLLNFDWFSVEEPVLYSSSEFIQFVLPTTTGYKGIHLDWADYVLITACILTISLLGLLLMHIIKIKMLKRKWEVTKMEGFDFINTNEENAPFSFLNNLFWKQSISLQEEGGQQIFKHEITHIQQKHTWDRIYCQIVASVFWMNPFIWMIQKELVAIHEFIADEEAVGNSNVEAFAKMLLQTHYGNHFLNPSHSFFYSSIKRRLAMLTKSKNTKYSYLRRVMVLPLLITVVCIVSIKVHASERIEKKVEEIKNNISLLVSDTTKPTILYIKVDSTNQSGKPIYFVDGVKISEKEANKITPEHIKAINVLKGELALKKYPNDGKNGIVEIVLKDSSVNEQPSNNNWTQVIGYKKAVGLENSSIKTLVLKNGVKLEVNGSIDTATISIDSSKIKNTPLYVLDGVPTKNIDNIQPNEIESINILKDPASKSLYGDAGKNGAILITTKKGHVGNLQNKMEEVTVTGYGTKLGIPSIQNIRRPNQLDALPAEKDNKINLQNKMEEVTVIGYGNKDKEAESEIAVFSPPTIQKNMDPKKNNDPIFYTVEKPAEFPGGKAGWSKYLMNNLNRDLLYKNKAVAGKYTVKLNFVVTSNGDVENVIAENNPGYGSAAEAIRVIEHGPKWIPAEQNGKKVNFLVKQIIVFTVAEK